MHRESNPAQVKPSRLTFGRVCIWCGERECRKPICVTRHSRSYWMICPDCNGTLARDCVELCGCVYGVIEAVPPGRCDR